MTDAFDLLTEARWEAEGTRRAVERYRDAAAAADPSALPSGQWLLREVVPPLADRIRDLQSGSFGEGGKKPRWALPIQTLDADTLAVITLTRVLRAAENEDGIEASLSAVAVSIAQAVRDEVDYRTWIKEPTNKDAVEAFRRRYPKADRSAWRRHKKRLELAASEPWDLVTSTQLGAALLGAVVEAAPDRFAVELRAISGGRRQKYLKLSAETRELLEDIETRAEIARPQLMPMLIPPIPWQYAER